MKAFNKFGCAAGCCLMILLTACGGNHAANGTKVGTAENKTVANAPQYGTFVPKLEIVHQFTEDPSWGEDIMVQSVLFGTPKRYYLGDHRAIRILAVDMNGKLLHSFLKKGQGPGEFQWLSGEQKLDDMLWVNGSRKLDSFSLDGILKSETRLQGVYNVFTMMDTSRFAGIRSELSKDGKTRKQFKRAGLWDLQENTLKTFKTSDKSGFFEFKRNGNHLFLSFGGALVPNLVLAADPELQRVYICETDTYQIDVLNLDGHRIRTIERNVEPGALTDQEIDKIAGNYRFTRMDKAAFRKELKKESQGRLCPVASLRVTPDSYLIVQRPIKHKEFELDMFSPTGKFLATLQNPEDINLSRATFLSHDRFVIVDTSGDMPVVTEYRIVESPFGTQRKAN